MATIDGTSDADTLAGGTGGDTLTGAAGGDRLTGGPGFDLYVVNTGDSPAATGLTNVAAIDIITDWSNGDRLLFVGAGPAPFGSLVQTPASADYVGAYDQAQTAYNAGAEYVAVPVGDDIFLFALRVSAAVRLAGASLADVQRFNIVSGTLDSGLVEVGGSGDDLRTFAAGGDRYDGGNGNDTVNGLAGADTLIGGGGGDQIFGGSDNDSISGGDGANYLRGDEGNDALQGGAGFDDINGNMGDDFITGGDGTDWVVGGKDDDIIFGDAGADIVYGNLGNDTVGGGVGADIVRGGQGDDVVRGDDDNDIVAGDRGADTISGGLGADIFLTFGEAGVDKVLDFSASEGDRVQLDPGTIYTLSQVDDDTVIEMVGGARMTLVGVQLSTLPNGWIFGN